MRTFVLAHHVDRSIVQLHVESTGHRPSSTPRVSTSPRNVRTLSFSSFSSFFRHDPNICPLLHPFFLRPERDSTCVLYFGISAFFLLSVSSASGTTISPMSMPVSSSALPGKLVMHICARVFSRCLPIACKTPRTKRKKKRSQKTIEIVNVRTMYRYQGASLVYFSPKFRGILMVRVWYK